MRIIADVSTKEVTTDPDFVGEDNRTILTDAEKEAIADEQVDRAPDVVHALVTVLSERLGVPRGQLMSDLKKETRARAKSK